MKKSKILLTALLVSCSLNSLSANLSASKKKSKPVQTSVSTEKKDIFANISRSELNAIGEKIFKNEAAGKKENLVYWNEGENFPSLGIGHFIWYKQGEPGIFEESFPQLAHLRPSGHGAGGHRPLLPRHHRRHRRHRLRLQAADRLLRRPGGRRRAGRPDCAHPRRAPQHPGHPLRDRKSVV